jgi:CheY-like chemotaxis protein
MKRKLLLVEDDPDQMGVLKLLLSRAGFDVHTATSALGAEELLKVAAVEMIVSDMTMPGGSGADLLRRIRSGAITAECAGLPFMLLTANLDDAKEVSEDARTLVCQKSNLQANLQGVISKLLSGA